MAVLLVVLKVFCDLSSFDHVGINEECLFCMLDTEPCAK